jgi:hypothetical protein
MQSSIQVLPIFAGGMQSNIQFHFYEKNGKQDLEAGHFFGHLFLSFFKKIYGLSHHFSNNRING